MEEVSLRAVALGIGPGHHLLAPRPALVPVNATHTLRSFLLLPREATCWRLDLAERTI